MCSKVQDFHNGEINDAVKRSAHLHTHTQTHLRSHWFPYTLTTRQTRSVWRLQPTHTHDMSLYRSLAVTHTHMLAHRTFQHLLVVLLSQASLFLLLLILAGLLALILLSWGL